MSYAPYTGPPGEQREIQEPPTRGSLNAPMLVILAIAALLLGLIAWTVWGRQMINEGPLTPAPAGSLPTVAVPLPAPKIGSPAPDFELVDVRTGENVKLSSFKGKPVWINFWATWCPPCKEEMPIMEKHYQDFKDEGLVILGVDVQEPKSDVLPYIEEGKYTWTFVIDTTGKITDNYRVSGLPSHFFVDKDGIIQAIVIGGLKSETTGQIVDVTKYLDKIIPK